MVFEGPQQQQQQQQQQQEPRLGKQSIFLIVDFLFNNAMVVEDPQWRQALRPGQSMDVDSAAAAAASSIMQLEDAQQGRCDPNFQGPAVSGRPDIGASTAQKTGDVENSSHGGAGGGGLTRGRGRSRQALGGISASDENTFSLFGGPSAAAHGPPSSAVMRKFPTTTLSSRSREFVSAAKSDMIAADRPPLCKAEYVRCDGSAMRLKDTLPCLGTTVIAV